MSKKRAELERRIRKAKQAKIDSMEYEFCESCGKSRGVRIDCSHIFSVDRRKDLADKVENITLACREDCHPKIELRQFDGMLNEDYLRKYIEENKNNYKNESRNI